MLLKLCCEVIGLSGRRYSLLRARPRPPPPPQGEIILHDIFIQVLAFPAGCLANVKIIFFLPLSCLSEAERTTICI